MRRLLEPPRVRIARVERRFGMGTLLVGTVFFAVLFACFKQMNMPWYGAVAVVFFLVGVGAAQMLIEDERKARAASMIAGALLYAGSMVTIGMIWRSWHFGFLAFHPVAWIWLIVSGCFAGYVGGVLMAGIFLVSRMIDESLARARGAPVPSNGLRTRTQVVRSIDEIRLAVLEARRRSQRVGLVPTMGALHEGHLSLIRRARIETDCVVVTIFVNPIQFQPKEDLSRYPRPFDQDVQLCREAGVDLIFAPDVSAIYPQGFASYVEVEGLSARMEGEFRPGHFRGVATVVLKLFNIVQPHVAYFGQKDAQQARIIEQMVLDLDVPVEVRVCPTVRARDGLALSSRNAYLSPADREHALAISRSLQAAKELIDAGERDANSVRHKMRSVLESALEVTPDYAELVEPSTFEPVNQITGPVLAVIAARVGSARLIDNLPIDVHAPNHH